jgi:hypothetical protein
MNKTELTKIKEMVKEENYGALNAYLKEIEYNLSLEELNSNTSKKRLNAIKKYLNKNLKMSKSILGKCDYQEINGKETQVFTNSYSAFFFADEEIIQGLNTVDKNEKEKQTYPSFVQIYNASQVGLCSISEENYITVGNIYQAISRAKSLDKDFVIFNLRDKSDDKSNQSFIYIAIKELEDVLTILDLKKNDVVATRPVRNNGKISLTSPITFKKNENAVAIVCPLYSNKKWDDTNEVQEMQVIEYDCLH